MLLSYGQRELSFYFIGIGGVSMSALAILLKLRGFRVRGSDDAAGESVRRLREKGIDVTIGREEEISENVVVYNSAIEETHPQLIAAKRAGKRLLTRAEMLGELAEEYPYVLSVSGSHGKTTCCAMISHVFSAAHKPFTCHIGGFDRRFSNCYASGNEYFITEACEYRRNFLSLQSDCAVVLNVDFDHSDYYKDERDAFEAFDAFAHKAKSVIVCEEDENAKKIPHSLSFGYEKGDYYAENLHSDGERYSFTVMERGIAVADVRLSVVGKVNVLNALAAFAVARRFGLSASEIKKGLQSFTGVERRFERVGTHCNAEIYCDYAHHPKEIAAAIQTAKKICRGELTVVFQPHTYTRTRDLMQKFVDVLGQLERVVIYQTYPAREEFLAEGSAYLLTAHLDNACYVQSPEQLKRRLSSGKRGDVVLVLGAGNIYEIIQSIIEKKTT